MGGRGAARRKRSSEMTSAEMQFPEFAEVAAAAPRPLACPSVASAISGEEEVDERKRRAKMQFPEFAEAAAAAPRPLACPSAASAISGEEEIYGRKRSAEMTQFPEFAEDAAVAPRPLACPSAASAVSGGMMARVIAVDHRQNNFQPEAQMSMPMLGDPDSQVKQAATQPESQLTGANKHCKGSTQANKRHLTTRIISLCGEEFLSDCGSGKTPFGPIKTCMCQESICKVQKLFLRHAAIGDPENVIPNFIWIPAMPKEQKKPNQTRRAQFVEMIYKQFGLDLSLASTDRYLSILHWPKLQRQAMINSKSDRFNRGVLLVDDNVKLILQLLRNGSLTEEDRIGKRDYWNKPGSIAGAVSELRLLEIRHWMAGEKLVRNCILGNGSLRPTTPYEGKTLHQKVWEEITFTTPDTDIVEDQNGNIRVAIPFWVRSTERDRHTKTGRKGVEVTLNVNALGDTLIPIPDSVKLMSAKDVTPSPLIFQTNKSAPRERKFKVMEGFIPVRDKHDNPIYQSRTSSKRGHWLVSDYLSEDDLKRVLDFSRKHRLADLGTVLFVLCKFVSDIPEAKRLWDKDRELENAQDSRFQEEIELCESFLQELFATAAEHISSNADFKRILNRFLWETWDPFNKQMDCVYNRRMQNLRDRLRRVALQGVPEEKHTEHLSHLSRLHKFVIILWSMKTKDEKLEVLYYKMCQGYSTSESFLLPLRHFSFTRLFHLMRNVLDEVESGINSLRAESFLRFCLVSHLLYDGSFPVSYEGLALQQVQWKKMSIAAIVDGFFFGTAVDIHVERFFATFAKKDEDIKLCTEELRVRTNPRLARYTNDFIAEFAQIFNRGTDSSIKFAVSVLRELGSKCPEYKAIIAKWLRCYEKGSFYKNILGNGSLGDFGL